MRKIKPLIQGKTVILLVIMVAALGLRLYKLAELPLYGDELTMVYDSFSLLKTGRDQLGNFFPLTFQMGAGRLAGYVYASIPFVFLFGPSALGVRLLSVISSLGLICLVYLLGKRLFSEKLGLIASFLLAISPWSLSLSRGGYEAHFALFLATLGIYFFLLAKKNTWYMFGWALSWGLAIHTYPTYKLVLPIIIPVLVWLVGGIKKIKLGDRKVIASILFLAVFAVASLSQTVFHSSEGRFSKINIFTRNEVRQEIIQRVNYERTISRLPSVVVPLFHNRPLEYFKLFLDNYLDNFSLSFLIVNGDGNPRHNMTGLGVFYWVELVFLGVGLFHLFRKKSREGVFLLLWILVAPLATAMIGYPHGLRSAFMLPPLILISATGLAVIFDQRRKYVLLAVIALLWGQLLLMANNLYFLLPNKQAGYWSQPAKLASELAISKRMEYAFIFISDKIDNIEYAYPVYAGIDPNEVIAQNQERSKVNDLEFKKLDNIYIGYLPETEREVFLNNLEERVLFIGDGEELKDKYYWTIESSDETQALIVKGFN